MIKQIKKTILENNLINENDTILIAFSGGADSVALLHILNNLSFELNFKIIANHINHNIRGKEAFRDAKFCEEFCRKHEIDFILSSVDAVKYADEQHLSLEEAARDLRYKELRKNAMNNKIAVAHHLNDNVETIIHNLIRGSGAKGLEGINIKNGNVIRPLLYTSKDDILSYIEENNLTFVEDSTNSDTNYTRNYIRKEIIPKFIKLNNQCLTHILNTSLIIKNQNKYFEEEAKKIFDKEIICIDNTIKFNSKFFNDLNISIKIEVLKLIIKTINNSNFQLKDWKNKHFNDIIESIQKNKASHLDLPYNITLDKKQGIVYITQNKENISMKRRVRK